LSARQAVRCGHFFRSAGQLRHRTVNIQRVYLANRRIWEAIDSAAPAAGIQTTNDHVDRYLEVLDAFLGEVA
jgi:hypothetical protein